MSGRGGGGGGAPPPPAAVSGGFRGGVPPGQHRNQGGPFVVFPVPIGETQVALGVVGVVQVPVGDRRARDRRVKLLRAAQRRQRGQVAAERPAADRDPAGV